MNIVATNNGRLSRYGPFDFRNVHFEKLRR